MQKLIKRCKLKGQERITEILLLLTASCFVFFWGLPKHVTAFHHVGTKFCNGNKDVHVTQSEFSPRLKPAKVPREVLSSNNVYLLT